MSSTVYVNSRSRAWRQSLMVVGLFLLSTGYAVVIALLIAEHSLSQSGRILLISGGLLGALLLLGLVERLWR